MVVYQEKRVPGRIILSAVVLIGIGVAVFCATSCHPGPPRFSPLPPEVISIEGYASLRLTRGGETAKSRLSFIFVLPDRGRIEALDPLGRTISILLMDNEEAFLVLPSKKAYWRAGRDEALAKLLGFELSPKEITDILSGNADAMSGWELEQDGQGRTVRGERDSLRFDVKQFFGKSALPQLLALSRGGEKGSLRIIRLNFNQPLKDAVFERAFLWDEAYRPTTWAEMEKWLKDEN
ncbi:MAG: lipoprotein insertase outer membrane protein LolB [Clostridiales bacterium]|nr:lipoprotein insertase outer membrane protein LolB [Clostridiales bacterium]